MIDPEVKRKRIEAVVKALVWGVGLAIAGPYIWMSLEGLFALAALVGTAGVLWSVAPGVAQAFANWRIKLLIAVIEANPIETMETLRGEKYEELQRAENAITDFDTQLGNFKDQVASVKKEYPEEAVAYEEIQARMQDCLDSMREEHRAAKTQLKDFEGRIKKAKVLFNMAKAANAMLEKQADAQAQLFADIKQQVSFEKVRTDLNRAFANMNTAIERRKNAALPPAKPQAALPAAPMEVIDLTKPQQRIGIRH